MHTFSQVLFRLIPVITRQNGSYGSHHGPGKETQNRREWVPAEVYKFIITSLASDAVSVTLTCLPH